jgi:hypothetical protein
VREEVDNTDVYKWSSKAMLTDDLKSQTSKTDRYYIYQFYFYPSKNLNMARSKCFLKVYEVKHICKIH